MDYLRRTLARIRWTRGDETQFIRSSKKPHYLVKLPFRRQYPRVFVGVGGAFFTFVLFSGPIYHGLFTRPEDVTPEMLLWHEEIVRGKTHIEKAREYRTERERKKEEKAAKKLLEAQAQQC